MKHQDHIHEKDHEHEHKSDSCCSHEVEHQHEHSHDHSHDHEELSTSCCGQHGDIVDKKIQLNKIPEGYASAVLTINEMDCPVEEQLIRQKFDKMPEIHEMQFNLIQRQLHLVYKGNLENILTAIKSLGMNAIPQGTKAPAPKNMAKRYWLLGISGALAVTAELISLFGNSTWFVSLLAIIAILLCGHETYVKGWIAIKNKKLNINALMSVAVTGAILIGEFPEAAMVMVLFTISEVLEARSLDRARNAIEGLMSLAPDESLVQENGSFVLKATDDIALNSIIRVMPGERFALDGEIIKGSSSIDESPITGESLPIDKTVGDKVYAGSINQEGEIEFKTTTTAENSTLRKIARTIEQAQGNKSETERFIDRFSAIYTPIVFVFAILVALVSPLFGFTWLDGIYNALVILIIACPCALVISTPVAIVSGLTTAARQGILIKGGSYLEAASHLKGLAFDKTGTITEGKPQVVESFIFTQDEKAASLAMSLAARSDHPISKAIVTFYQAQNMPAQNVESFEAILGHGTKGMMNGEQYYLGNAKLMLANNIDLTKADEALVAFKDRAHSVLMLANAQELLALFVLEDGVKATSVRALELLKARGLQLVMLSGDRQQTVDQVAQTVNLTTARGDQLPEDKMTFVNDFQKNSGSIGMIGDGINDAPALAKADIGFAMGSIGSDTAIETADVAIMDDDLMKLPNFLNIADRTMSIIRQNIIFSIGIKVFFLALAITGHAYMWMAVLADVGTSILVVLNALRLLKVKEIS